MPVKVEQINEYLFSDAVQSQKTKSGSDEISQGKYRGYPSKTVTVTIDYFINICYYRTVRVKISNYIQNW